MHLSPYEQQTVLPWLRTFPKKMQQRFTTYLWPFGSLAFTYGVIAWSEAKDYEEDYEHRF